MSEDKPAAESFDLERLQQLVEMMQQYDLREVKLSKGGEQWILRRGPQEVISAVPQTYAAPPPPQAAPQAPSAPAAAGASESSDDGLIAIKSPTVGTFYSSPSPDDPPFVKIGDKVQPDTVVCLVEAMKVFNQIPAECSGAIVKALVKDGDAVEFGQPLFHVRPE